MPIRVGRTRTSILDGAGTFSEMTSPSAMVCFSAVRARNRRRDDPQPRPRAFQLTKGFAPDVIGRDGDDDASRNGMRKERECDIE